MDSTDVLAAEINKEALELQSNGYFHAAEKKYLQALKMKEESNIPNPIGIALSQNALAELYLKIEKLDPAQDLLEKAYNVRKGCDNFDRSCTADNLGRLFEMRGDLEKAGEWRKANGPHRMICSYLDCRKSQALEFSRLDELKKCARCKCVYYCGKECQRQDWARHKPYCKLSADKVTK